MAIVFIEGFDHVSAAGLAVKGWSGGFSSVQPGRFAGQCGRPSSSFFTKTLPSNYPTLTCGFAYRNSVSGSKSMLDLRVGSTRTVRVQADASNHVQILNSGGTVIAVGTTAMPTSPTWTYIEVKVTIGTSGTVEVHLNGNSASPEITSTVGNFGTSNIDTIALTGVSGQTTDFDDMYACDTSGTANTSFLGDVRISTIAPTGAGAHTQFTPNGAADNWDCVDEEPPDDDTTYVSDATVGDIDSYAYGDVDGGATVYAAQVCTYARKDDAATRQIAPVVRQGGTDYVGSTVTLGASYQYFTQIYDQDPTSSNWTAANVNGDEFGVKVIA